MLETEKNYQSLKEYVESISIPIFGVANIEKLSKKVEWIPEATQGFKHAISIAIPLSSTIIDKIIDRPDRLYLHHYRTANMFLDQAGFKITTFIQEQGHDALPIPASIIIDWRKQIGHLNHRVVAQEAGLGWIGKNRLLIHPKYRAKVRLVTILTNMPLVANDEFIESKCEGCNKCMQACPVNAIKDKIVDFDIKACLTKLQDFSKSENLGHYICGLCIKACK
ncbi:MAG: 4Fe-4S binding protein [bacterium]|nr:4Fe-4S binding protein [bacterium]